jgi:polyphosphate kinase 2
VLTSSNSPTTEAAHAAPVRAHLDERSDEDIIRDDLLAEIEALRNRVRDQERDRSKALRQYRRERELMPYQGELLKLQRHLEEHDSRMIVLFEGRDAAGKGGTIRRVTRYMNEKHYRVVALGRPTQEQRTQWYFQRYAEHLPAAGEMVLFDRSWYNRSNVEWVMGYCSEEEHQEFLRSCPEFERMLVRSGILILKYWFSVSFEEQRSRFEARNAEPLKRWKLSDMDLAEHELYVRYSMAKDTTFQYTDIKQAPWYVVPSDDKRASRLNCISHLLSQFDFQDVAPDVVSLPEMRQIPYVRPPMHEQTFVPRRY